MTHPSTQVVSTMLPTTSTDVTVSVTLPYPLLRDVTRRWPGWTLDEKISHAIVLALAWHDHGGDDDDAVPAP